MALDAVTNVLQAILDDVACNREVDLVTTSDGKQHIDYAGYLKKHYEMLESFDNKKEVAPILELVTDEEVHIFGGTQ